MRFRIMWEIKLRQSRPFFKIFLQGLVYYSYYEVSFMIFPLPWFISRIRLCFIFNTLFYRYYTSYLNNNSLTPSFCKIYPNLKINYNLIMCNLLFCDRIHTTEYYYDYPLLISLNILFSKILHFISRLLHLNLKMQTLCLRRNTSEWEIYHA